jgi:DNA adenine methylase
MIDKLPYSWFGGKRTVAPIAWKAFGNCINYVEPFFGGGAVLLMRPDYDSLKHTETVNDIDCNLANFWRAVKADPEEVAWWADYPVSEIDLGARNRWLVTRTYSNESKFVRKMQNNPEFYDAKQAGWWVWGINLWIGSGFCDPDKTQQTLPSIGNGGRGVHRKLPHLSCGRQGTHRKYGNPILEYILALSERFRKVRVCCGDFDRVLGGSVTFKHGLTGIFLDPPYSAERSQVYGKNDSQTVAKRAADWAFANGDNPKLRIILCGYKEEHDIPPNWYTYEWKAQGGYSLQSKKQGRENSTKERLWLSPHCLPIEVEQKQLELAFS